MEIEVGGDVVRRSVRKALNKATAPTTTTTTTNWTSKSSINTVGEKPMRLSPMGCRPILQASSRNLIPGILSERGVPQPLH
ncbi:hypothetical protein QJS04_geneDACA021177 [Acorus gramineus]|uniref:Uncharacterized protein n=1 Tax=Acorus gramineus TaxID=55184 RepID=A0AAV9AC11_ACOGR|nr:hypothetical protein QJS04_geneDACA021177 [Acorus gramineus]